MQIDCAKSITAVKDFKVFFIKPIYVFRLPTKVVRITINFTEA